MSKGDAGYEAMQKVCECFERRSERIEGNIALKEYTPTPTRSKKKAGYTSTCHRRS